MTVSVVMSAYNEQENIRNAIDSIINQSYQDFEFIIVNDGSTDATESIITSYRDNRIVLISKGNSGLSDSLAVGIERATGGYIARMDADDISDPRRLEKEVLFLNKNQEVALLGSWCKIITKNGIKELRLPTHGGEIRRFLVRDNPFVHSSVMFRKKAYKEVGGYNRHLRNFEDYDLWIRLASRHRVANIPEFLVTRIENNNIKNRAVWQGLKCYDIYKKRLEMQWKACRLMGLTLTAPFYLLKTVFSMMICKLGTKI